MKNKIPVVVIEGSGRLADAVSMLIHERQESPEDFDISKIEDEWLRGVMNDDKEFMQSNKEGTGLIHLYNINDPVVGLRQLILELVERQRTSKE